MSDHPSGPAGLQVLIAPDLRRGIGRFPVPCALAALLALAVILEQYGVALDGALQERLDAGLVAAALAALAIDLLAEGRGWQLPVRLGAHCLALALNAVLHVVPLPWRASDPLLIPGLLLLVSVAGFLRPQAALDAFWRFNERLWVAAGLALLGAGAFALGIFAIDRSLDILFGIDFEELVTRIVFPLSFCLLAPLIWFSAVPRIDAPGELGPDDFLERAARLIARLILVPLLMTYAVILLAYSAQIAASWSMPEGRVGWMVSAFGSAGALTVLLLYPERRAGGLLVRWFMRWWFALTIVPVVLLVLAIELRVGAYGVTAPRYVLMLIAMWLGAMAGLFAWSRSVERDIRLIPGLAALLLLAGSFGPWGAAAVGVSSQIDEFVAIARDEGWMNGDRLRPAALDRDLGRGARRPGEAADRARSILHHIAAEDGLGMLERRLENPEALLDLARRNRDLRRAFAEDLGVDVPHSVPKMRSVAVSPSHGARDIARYGELFGPVELVARGDGPAARPGRLEGNRVALAIPGHGRVSFSLEPGLPDAEDEGPVLLPGFTTVRLSDGRKAAVLILDAGGRWIDGALDLDMLRLVVLLPRTEAKP